MWDWAMGLPIGRLGLNGRRLLRKYKADESGQFALMFSVCISTILVGVSVAIDHISLGNTKTKTQNVLDASLMAAARIYQIEDNVALARKAGRDAYSSLCQNVGCETENPPNIMIVDTANSSGFSVTGMVEGTMDPLMFNVISERPLNYVVDSQVIFHEPSGYNDIYFVMDWSASLGIAATPAEMETLKTLTAPFISGMPAAAEGCAFACHQDEFFIQPEVSGSVVTTYEFARANGINLREDELANAVDQVVTSIFDQASTTTRVGLYVVSDTLEEVEAATNIPFDVSSSLNGVSLAKYATRFDLAMPNLTFDIGQSGGGTGPTDTTKTVVLVTDGLNNNYGGGIITGPFQSSYCDGLKANGVEIAVLHLPYPDLGSQAWYQWFAEPHLAQTETALRDCATNGMYYQADQTAEMLTALQTIADTVVVSSTQELAFAK